MEDVDGALEGTDCRSTPLDLPFDQARDLLIRQTVPLALNEP
jgi:hypothetical protein